MNHAEGGGKEFVLRTNAPPIGHMNYQGVNAKVSPRMGGANRVGDDSALNYQRGNNSAFINSNDETAYPSNANPGAPGLLPDIQQRHRPP